MVGGGHSFVIPRVLGFLSSLRFLLPIIGVLVALLGWQTWQLDRCKLSKAKTEIRYIERAVESGEKAIQASNEQQARRDDLSRETQEVIDEIRQMEPSLDCDSPAVRRAVERVWGREAD